MRAGSRHRAQGSFPSVSRLLFHAIFAFLTGSVGPAAPVFNTGYDPEEPAAKVTISPLRVHSGTARSRKASATLSGGGSPAGFSPGKIAARSRVRATPGSIRLTRTEVRATSPA